MIFFDVETCEKVTIEQLYNEYIENRKNNPFEYNYDFKDYIKNSLTSHNGTLEIIK